MDQLGDIWVEVCGLRRIPALSNHVWVRFLPLKWMLDAFPSSEMGGVMNPKIINCILNAFFRVHGL